MRDLEFISGEFFETEIPKDKQFLLKYFQTERQLAFLRYYLVFQDVKCFTAHTGIVCSRTYLWEQENLYLELMNAYKQAKSEITTENLELLSLIESGKFKP